MDNIWDKYPTLYHYTSFDAAKKIIKNQTLWATHYEHLNDSTEFYFFKEIFAPKIILPRLKEFFVNYKEYIDQEKLALLGELEPYYIEESEILANAMYKALQGSSLFISSFCGEHKEEYSKHNGLLSQWRAYGNPDGCILVFDTQELFNILKSESEKYHGDCGIYEAIYGENDPILNEATYEKWENDLSDYVANVIKSVYLKQPEADAENAWRPFVGFASSYKHPAFHEEKEARIAILNLTFGGEGKEAWPTQKRGESIEYIELFSSPETKRSCQIKIQPL